MNEFNEAMFKTKVDNIFVKLYTCITKGNLTDVKHFISKDLEDNFQNKINEISSHNQRQIYDEINVKNTRIIDRVVTEEKEIIKVEIISRYMDYIIDLDTGDTIRGDDTRRIEKTNSNKKHIKEKIKYILSLGFTMEEVIYMIKKYPPLISLSIENINSKVEGLSRRLKERTK